MSGRIRVLIVEDSLAVQELLKHVIGRDPRLEVVAVAGSAEQALRMLARVSPDVIALDMRLPGMDGLQATLRIMAEKPTPIVLISASVNTRDLDLTMRALQAGALAVIEKPVARMHDNFDRLAERLCTQLAMMSQVKVIRQRPLAELPRPLAGQAAAERLSYRAVGIAASTGGPGALATLLGALGREFPLPVLVIQHLGPGFLKGFGAWLRGACPLPVAMVETQRLLEPGTVYVAARDRHLLVNRTVVYTEETDPVECHRPSATVLFRSLARSLQGGAIGVVLTGMGADGAAGLLELRSAGGYTIAEDQSSAAVYGMPGSAVRLGAVCESLPLGAISHRILELMGAPPGGSTWTHRTESF